MTRIAAFSIGDIPIEVTSHNDIIMFETQFLLTSEQRQDAVDMWEALRTLMFPEQQDYEETAVLATLTDNQLCDVLLASYTPIAERTMRSWER